MAKSAASAPDLSTLTSSSQVFSSGTYTLAQIRALHGQLVAGADDNAARLRTRVGGSYRELLGTADTIVRMRDDMDRVQAVLGRMGAHCGRVPVSSKVARLAKFVRERHEEGEDGDDKKNGGEDNDGGCRDRGQGAKKATRSRRVQQEGEDSDEEEDDALTQEGSVKLGVIARASLLEACGLAVPRVLKGGAGLAGGHAGARGKAGADKTLPPVSSRGERLVLAVKTLVLMRLLLTSFSESGDGGSKTIKVTVASATKNLASLRRRLLRTVERVLQRAPTAGAMRDDKVKQQHQAEVLCALSAHCLATGFGARDVLGHFLHVRELAMALAFQSVDGHHQDEQRVARTGPRDVLGCLGLYTRTLLDVQALVPHRLTEALVGLKKDGLLADESLRAIEGLRLDIYGRWCGDEIQFFKPFIRHDDLDGPHAREILAKWADKGADIFLQGLARTLDGMTDFGSIIELRTGVLRLWVAEGAKARGLDPQPLLHRIRAAVKARMLHVLEAKVAKLRLVGAECQATLGAWCPGASDRQPGLWDEAFLDELDLIVSPGDAARGAARFARDVVARLHGRSDTVAKAVACYASWQRVVVDDIGLVIAQLRQQRWDGTGTGGGLEAGAIGAAGKGGDGLAAMADDDLVLLTEDEEAIEQRQRQLSEEDPQALQDHLDTSLAKAFTSLDEHLGLLWGAHREGPNGGHVAMYFLRVLRDVRARLPEQQQQQHQQRQPESVQTQTEEAVARFGLAAVPSMHAVLVSHVAGAPVAEFASALALAAARRPVAGRILWDGEPALPTSPSPAVFQLLRGLCGAMAGAGGDLWSPAAVAALGRSMRARLCAAFREAAKQLEQQPKVGGKERQKDIAVIAGDVNEDDGGEAEEEKEQEKKEGEETEKQEDEGGNEDKGRANDGAHDPERDGDDLAVLEQRQKDVWTQWLCDVRYFEAVFGPEELGALAEDMWPNTGLESAVAQQRITEACQEYWRKTSLLFGLLAQQAAAT